MKDGYHYVLHPAIADMNKQALEAIEKTFKTKEKFPIVRS